MASREDALRHLRGFQCCHCGKRFGKLYALKKHMKLTKRCVRMSTNTIKDRQNSPGLAEAIVKLQHAKKEDIYPAIKLCLKYYSKY